MSVYAKLLAIQQELKAPKGQYNSFGKYHYRSCEDILEALKPLLKRQGCILILGDEGESRGQEDFIKVTARLIDTEDGAEMSTTSEARVDKTKKGMDGSQISGSASSYARKYALNGLFAIDDQKDSDTRSSEDNAPEPLLCPVCGKPVGNATGKSGNVVAPETVLEELGSCLNCYRKARLAKQEEES